MRLLLRSGSLISGMRRETERGKGGITVLSAGDGEEEPDYVPVLQYSGQGRTFPVDADEQKLRLHGVQADDLQDI